jgi:hypothetical protein
MSWRVWAVVMRFESRGVDGIKNGHKNTAQIPLTLNIPFYDRKWSNNSRQRMNTVYTSLSLFYYLVGA